MYKILILIIYFILNQAAFAHGLITQIELKENSLSNNIISISTNTQLNYKLFKLENPNRVVIDFQNTKANIHNFDITSPLISKVRSGIRDNNNLRLVIEVKNNKIISSINSYYITKNKKYNLIISIDYKDKLTNNLILTNPIENESAIKYNTKKPVKPTIVIDAGHGGEDPGTIGRYTNTYEKNITLKYAKTLAILLEKSNLYNIVLTRDKDKFITLAGRVAKAKEVKADLFISLHADSHADPNVQGLSVYTLSEDSQNTKIDETEKEFELIYKKSDHDEIKEILDNLVDRKNKNIAIEFASSLIAVIGKEVNIVKNSHRFAGFKVLKNEEVPAVLIELGYLSNKQEEKLLLTDKYRSKIINALIMAINHHFEKKF